MKLGTCLLALLLQFTTCAIGGTPVATSVDLTDEKSLGVSLMADAAWRHDSFEWTIAGDRQGRHPNILSDLDWTHLEIIPVALAAEIQLPDHWRARLGGGYGRLLNGQNRDSDYDSNNRKRESSRSHADTNGHTVDADFAIGYELPEAITNVTLTPWVGLSYHQQHFNDFKGVQNIDKGFNDLGPFRGLHSSYVAEWRSVTLGLDARIRLTDATRFVLHAHYDRGTYEAVANWNLRTDFKGFNHHAVGNGISLSSGVEWDIAPRWTLGLHAGWSLFKTNPGVDHTDFSNGSSEETQLNEVKWTSISAHASVTYRF